MTRSPKDLPEPDPPKMPMWGYCCMARMSKMKGTPFWGMTRPPSPSMNKLRSSGSKVAARGSVLRMTPSTIPDAARP